MGVFLAYAALSLSPHSSFAFEINVLKSKDAKPFDLFLSGFMETVPDAKIHVANMKDDITKGVEILEAFQGENPQMILALGAKAAWITREVSGIPVIFAMVSGPEKYKLDDMAGVTFDIPSETYLKQAKQVMPYLQKVGIIHSDDKHIEEVRHSAKKMELVVLAEKISSLKEIQAATDKLLPEVDALWMLSDPVIMSSPRAVKELIILRALRMGVPVIGFNKWLVKNGGALFCLYSDYDDIGRQTGRLVHKINRNSSHSHVIEPPEKLKVFMNAHVLERLSQRMIIKIPRNAYFSD
ncbi:MAG: hypothetical protein KZQ88_11585 [Candidatus Thiodiazotropha sp. (ex Dulcina madagascariensis)]|nr:hypothetical protein [Candidatus Thiodiazotropha sp. (ex Dulcina madagascariensis)]MCU7928083.1 hypothetical protein [Candidatus Thiodiazotropha sp. (ex Dulcina madagascariensis)]